MTESKFTVNEVGDRIDNAIAHANGSREVIVLQWMIHLCETERDNESFEDITADALNYFLSNAYQCLAGLTGDYWDNPYLSLAIISFRKALRENIGHNLIASQVSVNYANLLKSLGRAIEVIPLWKEGAETPGDSREVSLYQLADTLLLLSQYLYDSEHRFYYQQQAYYYLKRLMDDLEVIRHPGIKQDLASGSASSLREFWEHAHRDLSAATPIAELPNETTYSNREKWYRQWCKDNVLFINPLNDISQAWVVAHDPMNFPSYVVELGTGPLLAAAFSSMKNEFCFYRHTLFEGVNGLYAPYTDIGKHLADTQDGVLYGGDIEKIKSALRGCFSVLDKVAQLLTEYFQLNKKDTVGFNRNWFGKHNQKLASLSNPFVLALSWLAKDFTQHESDDRRPAYWLEEHAWEVKELRNHLEHGWVHVVNGDYLGHRWSDTHDYAYRVDEDGIKKKALYVLKQTRSALIYLCLAIHCEEQKKVKDKVLALEEVVITY